VYRKTRASVAFFGLIVLVACGNPVGSIEPASAESVRIFEPSTAPLSGLVSEAEEFDQPSNQGRRKILASLLRKHNLNYELQQFEIGAGEGQSARQGCNVITALGGGSRALVIGAHFDSAPLPKGRISPGMVDNAAAVVLLIHLAEAIQHVRLSHRVYFVFFDAEEVGMLGSNHFVRSADRDSLDAMINVDIAAYGDTVIFGPSHETERSALDRAVQDCCAQLGLDCLGSPRLPPGDHQSFQSAGVPSTSIALLPGRQAHQVWLLFNWPEASGLAEGFAPPVAQIIHSENDIPENLDPAAMTMVYNLIGTLLVELDGRIQRK
jgi:hypothetical protein